MLYATIYHLSRWPGLFLVRDLGEVDFTIRVLLVFSEAAIAYVRSIDGQVNAKR